MKKLFIVIGVFLLTVSSVLITSFAILTDSKQKNSTIDFSATVLSGPTEFTYDAYPDVEMCDKNILANDANFSISQTSADCYVRCSFQVEASNPDFANLIRYQEFIPESNNGYVWRIHGNYYYLCTAGTGVPTKLTSANHETVFRFLDENSLKMPAETKVISTGLTVGDFFANGGTVRTIVKIEGLADPGVAVEDLEDIIPNDPTPTTYSVSFYAADNTTVIKTISNITLGSSILSQKPTLAQINIPAYTPPKEFKNWNTQPAGTGNDIFDYHLDNIISDLSLYPVLQTKNYTVTVDVNTKESSTFTHSIVGGNVYPGSAAIVDSVYTQGSMIIEYGSTTNFYFTPNSSYKISRIEIDGQNMGAINTWSFSGVAGIGGVTAYDSSDRNHTIIAYFEKQTYSVSAQGDAGCTVSPTLQTGITHGSNASSISIQVLTGYNLSSVTINGINVLSAPVAGPSTYTQPITNVTQNTSVIASTATGVFQISTSTSCSESTYSSHGSILCYDTNMTSASTNNIAFGSSRIMVIQPENFHKIKSITLDGVNQTITATAGNSQTIQIDNINSNHTLTATFELNSITFTTTVLNSAAGSVSLVNKTNNSSDEYHSTVISQSASQISISLVRKTSASTPQVQFSTTTVSSPTIPTFVISTNVGYQLQNLTVSGSTITTFPHVRNVASTGQIASINHAVQRFTISTSLDQYTTATNNAGNVWQFNYGSSVTVQLSPTATTSIYSLSINGVAVIQNGAIVNSGYHTSINNAIVTILFGNSNNVLNKNYVITASSREILYSVSVSYGSNGQIRDYLTNSIINSGQTYQVLKGSTQQFKVVANEGFQIATINKNGTLQPALAINTQQTTLTLSNITENFVIEATFKPYYYYLTYGSTLSGRISANPMKSVGTDSNFTYNNNESVVVTITPESGKYLSALTINGTSFVSGGTTTASPSVSLTDGRAYSFTLVMTENKSLVATFTTRTLTITASSNNTSLGTVSPYGTRTVNWNANLDYTITPITNYQINWIKVDNVALSQTWENGEGTTFTFSQIQANHTLEVEFGPREYTLVIDCGSHGTIEATTPLQSGVTTTTVSGKLNSAYAFYSSPAKTITLTVTPDAHYYIDEMALDTTLLTSPAQGLSYTIEIVLDGDKYFGANFSIIKRSITYNITGQGSIVENIGTNYNTISSSTTVEYNDGQTVNLALVPSTSKYRITSLNYDGSLQDVSAIYPGESAGKQFESINTNHTVSVTFELSLLILNINGGTGVQPKVIYRNSNTQFMLVNPADNSTTNVPEPFSSTSGEYFYYYSEGPNSSDSFQDGRRYDIGVWEDMPPETSILYATYLTPTANYDTAGNNQENIVVPKTVTHLENTTSSYVSEEYETNVRTRTITRYFNAFGVKYMEYHEIDKYIGSDTTEYHYFNNYFAKKITLPASMTFGDGVVEGCDGVTFISYPSSVTSFDSSMVSQSQETVYFKSAINSLGTDLFNGCTHLVNLIDFELVNITSLPDGLFKNCSSLIELTIPNSLASFNDNAFPGTTNHEYLFATELNTHYSDDNGVLYNNAFTSVVKCPRGRGNSTSPQTYTILNTTTAILTKAFNACEHMTSIVFAGTSVNSIQNYAFYGARALVSLPEINLQNNLTSLGEYAFGSCTSLESISFATSVTTIGNNCFKDCTALSSFTATGITTIGNYAFSECLNLSTLSLGAVSSIGTMAFEYCSSLTAATITSSIWKSSVGTIGTYVFQHCTGLTSMSLSKTTIPVGTFYYCSNLVSLTLTSTQTIGSYAFARTSISSLVLPTSLVSIGTYAFTRCNYLQAVAYQGDSTAYHNLSSIGAHAFYNCSQLTSVHLSQMTSTATIGTNALGGCPLLVEFMIHRNGNPSTNLYDLSGMQCGVWYYSSTLGGSTITVVGNQLGENGNGFYTSVGSPDDWVVEGSSGNYYITAYIGTSNNTALAVPKTAYYSGSPVTITGVKCLYNTAKGSTISPSTWTEITFANGIQWVGDNGTNNIFGSTTNPSVSEIILPTTLTQIKKYAFYGCSGLTSVVIPSSVSNIATRAFQNCSNLSTLSYNPSVDLSISSFAFKDCNISSLSRSDRVTSIGQEAFANNNLTTLVLGTTCSNIGQEAFIGNNIRFCSVLYSNSNNLILGSNCFGTALATLYLGKAPSTEFSLPALNYYFENSLSKTNTANSQGVYSTIARTWASDKWSVSTCSADSSIKQASSNVVFSGTLLAPYRVFNTDTATITYTPAFRYSVESTVTTLNLGYVTHIMRAPRSVQTLTSLTRSRDIAVPTVHVFESEEFTLSDYHRVKYIADYAFDGCSALTNDGANIFDSVEFVGQQAFQGCSSLTTLNFNKAFTLTRSYTNYSSMPYTAQITYCSGFLNTIEANAFPANITTITFGKMSGIDNVSTIAFYSTNYNIEIVIPGARQGSAENCATLAYEEYANSLADCGIEHGTKMYQYGYKTMQKHLYIHDETEQTYDNSVFKIHTAAFEAGTWKRKQYIILSGEIATGNVYGIAYKTRTDTVSWEDFGYNLSRADVWPQPLLEALFLVDYEMNYERDCVYSEWYEYVVFAGYSTDDYGRELKYYHHTTRFNIFTIINFFDVGATVSVDRPSSIGRKKFNVNGSEVKVNRNDTLQLTMDKNYTVSLA